MTVEQRIREAEKVLFDRYSLKTKNHSFIFHPSTFASGSSR